MKKIAITILVATSVYVLLYLIGAFITMDLNPTKWDVAGRAMMAIMGTIIAIPIAVATYNELD